MFDLPTELSLQILSYLPFASLNALQVACKSFHDFFVLHDTTIFRNAAWAHDYISSPTTLLPEIRSLYSKRSLEGVDTFKDLCRKRLDIQHSWAGKGPSAIVEYHSTSKHRYVHRIKVDELGGYIMTTSKGGGLLVTDLNDDEVLWSLPLWYVRPYAHLEYGQGYMIFDREDGQKEVWRRVSDVQEGVSGHRVEISSTPDLKQKRVYDEVRSLYMNLLDPESTLGQFQPWALLRMPEPTRAYRFVYPTLLVSSFQHVYLWDIPSGKLIQTLDDIQNLSAPDAQPDVGLGSIKYVEMSSRHVFLAGGYLLRVFDRLTGKSVMDIPSTRQRYGFWKYDLKYAHGHVPGSVLVRHEFSVTGKEYTATSRLLIDQLVAVHVSSCGLHLVALLRGSKLFVLHDFEKFIGRDPSEIYAHTLDLQIGSPRSSQSVYLAYEHGRISAVTTNGVFIIEVDMATLTDMSNAAPTVTICRIPHFLHPSWLSSVTCLMMSDTGLYLNWNPTSPSNPEALEIEFEESLEDPARGGELYHRMCLIVLYLCCLTTVLIS
ncbi:hypothetical protein B0H34DRAFT_736501 [Crassisporium funariophilum]|nr:hypothetical protein B0H34DRAFT_736501 [Crassisporium funariophilum]